MKKLSGLQPKITKRQKKKDSDSRLWAHDKLLKKEGLQAKIIDLRRDKSDVIPIKKSYYRTSTKNYISFDLLQGETEHGNSFSTPKIFFSSYYKVFKVNRN